jgi:AbrB family looped-hinge helix DNA binding protein
MQQTATITSKRQLTIPVEIFRQLRLKQGNKVIVSLEDDSIKIVAASSLVEKLAGSVKIPAEFKNMSIEQIVLKAKSEYFKSKA